MCLDRLAGEVDVGVLGQSELADTRTDHALTGYVEKSDNTGFRHPNDVLAKGGKGVGAG